MRVYSIAVAVVFASTVPVGAGDVLPSQVSYEEGAIVQSLTGVPGDAASGREIVGNKGLGNCVACHEVTDLADVPFQGEIGPMLDGAGGRWSAAELRGIVANAKIMFPDSMMPSFYRTDGFIRPGDAYTGKAAVAETFGPLLTAQQVEDVVAYLATLQ
jgi:sulfur-oxidizing protein SoxX